MFFGCLLLVMSSFSRLGAWENVDVDSRGTALHALILLPLERALAERSQTLWVLGGSSFCIRVFDFPKCVFGQLGMDKFYGSLVSPRFYQLWVLIPTAQWVELRSGLFIARLTKRTGGKKENNAQNSQQCKHGDGMESIEEEQQNKWFLSSFELVKAMSCDLWTNRELGLSCRWGWKWAYVT